MGRRYTQLTIDERWAIAHLHAAPDPANRCNSGSRAVDHCPRAAQLRSRLRATGPVCRPAGAAGAAPPRPRPRLAPPRPRRPHASWCRSPAAWPARPASASSRVHRPLHLCATHPHHDFAWRHYLPQAKSTRGWRGRTGRSPASFIAHRRPLADRPSAAADRQTPGHWEADLMLFRTAGQAVLTLPSATLARRRAWHPSPASWPSFVAPDPHLRQRHRVGHHLLHALGLASDPLMPPGRLSRRQLRRSLPRKTDLVRLPDHRFTQLAGLQQHPAQVPRLPDPRRGLLGSGVALEM